MISIYVVSTTIFVDSFLEFDIRRFLSQPNQVLSGFFFLFNSLQLQLQCCAFFLSPRNSTIYHIPHLLKMCIGDLPSNISPISQYLLQQLQIKLLIKSTLKHTPRHRVHLSDFLSHPFPPGHVGAPCRPQKGDKAQQATQRAFWNLEHRSK